MDIYGPSMNSVLLLVINWQCSEVVILIYEMIQKCTHRNRCWKNRMKKKIHHSVSSNQESTNRIIDWSISSIALTMMYIMATSSSSKGYIVAGMCHSAMSQIINNMLVDLPSWTWIFGKDLQLKPLTKKWFSFIADLFYNHTR